MLLTVKSTLMIRFIGITLILPLIKYEKALMHAYFREYKHQYFGYFHEGKHQDFWYFHEYKHQELDNIGEAILWKIKRIVSHEGLHIATHRNDNRSWYYVLVKWWTGGTITESLTIIIGVDTFTYVFYPYDVQEKEEG